MDYSNLSHDPDHPAGSSPWQSPQPSGTNFGPLESSSGPPSPLARQSQLQSPYKPDEQHHVEVEERDQNTLSGNDQRESRPQNGGYIPSPTSTADSPDLSERLQGPPLTEQEYQQQRQQHFQPPQQQHQRHGAPHRYHQGVRSASRQQLPQYKLQAKITGLERTGKKDPILRFDVHVCFGHKKLP